MKKVLVPRIFGIGTDIQVVDRMERFLIGNEYKRSAFLNRVFHPTEVEAFTRKSEGKSQWQFLASRWALKEAVVKASGETRLQYPGIYLEKPPKIEG